MFMLFRDKLPFQYLVIMIAVVGFNPFFWDYKDQIVPVYPSQNPKVAKKPFPLYQYELMD